MMNIALVTSLPLTKYLTETTERKKNWSESILVRRAEPSECPCWGTAPRLVMRCWPGSRQREPDRDPPLGTYFCRPGPKLHSQDRPQLGTRHSRHEPVGAFHTCTIDITNAEAMSFHFDLIATVKSGWLQKGGGSIAFWGEWSLRCSRLCYHPRVRRNLCPCRHHSIDPPLRKSVWYKVQPKRVLSLHFLSTYMNDIPLCVFR